MVQPDISQNPLHQWCRLLVMQATSLCSEHFRTVLSVRFEVGVSLLVAPVKADKRVHGAPFPLVENAGIQPVLARDSQESTRRSSGLSRVLLKALQKGFVCYKSFNLFSYVLVTWSGTQSHLRSCTHIYVL